METSVSWTAGFAIIAGAFVLATAVFLLGSPRYRHWPPGGSPLTRIARVAAAAVAHRRAAVPADAAGLHEVEGPLSAVPGQCKLPRCAPQPQAARHASHIAAATAEPPPLGGDGSSRCLPPLPCAPSSSLPLLRSTHSFKCLERAAVRCGPPGGKPDRWLVTLTEVEEVRGWRVG